MVKELLGYVRFRQDRLSDFGRVQRQQEVISKLKEEAVSMNSVVKLPDLLDLLHTYVDTNIDTSTLLKIGKDLLMEKSNEVKHYGSQKMVVLRINDMKELEKC